VSWVITTATHARVHRSVSNSLARAPCSRACSTLGAGRPTAWDRGPSVPTAQGIDTALLKTGMPDMGALVGHAELAGSLGLGAALGEQLGGAQPSGLTGGTLILGLDAGGRHRRTLTQHQPSRQPNPRVK
jgi:hypothetical protein